MANPRQEVAPSQDQVVWPRGTLSSKPHITLILNLNGKISSDPVDRSSGASDNLASVCSNDYSPLDV